MDRKINITFNDAMGRSFPFQSLLAFYDFIESERSFWSEHFKILEQEKIPMHHVFHTHVALGNILETIDQWKSVIDTWTEEQFNAHFEQVRVQLNRLKNWFWSAHAHVPALIECNKKYGVEAATAFQDMVLGGHPHAINSRKHFEGIMSAYEFLHPESEITKRSQSEKISLEHLRGELFEAKSNLITEIDNLKTGFNHWDINTKSDWDSWKSRENATIEKFRNDHAAHFGTLVNNWNQQISALEKTYEEKLRLEKPAQYWKTRADSLRIQAFSWVGILAVIIVAGMFYFTDLFKDWLQGQEIALSLHSFQGAILLAVIISSFVYLIKIVSRLAFSAFHLQRDAEEREQLAHLYLSLTNENHTDDESRKIILQSLFSRAETGLLHNENGPTMPIVEMLRAGSSQR